MNNKSEANKNKSEAARLRAYSVTTMTFFGYAKAFVALGHTVTEAAKRYMQDFDPECELTSMSTENLTNSYYLMNNALRNNRKTNS